MIDVSAALVVTSDETSKRMEVDYVEFNTDINDQNSDETVYDYILDETQTFQEILGFGGAFTGDFFLKRLQKNTPQNYLHTGG